MNKLQKLRWNTLMKINFPYKILEKIIKEKYNVPLEEKSINEFISNNDKYEMIDNDNLLFLLENNGFKKLMIFSIREKEMEEIINETFKQDFINRNMLEYVRDKEDIVGIGDDMKCVYFNENGNYITIKMAQVRKTEVEDLKETGHTGIKDIEYYDCVKFIIDCREEILFMFYNDVNTITGYDLGNNQAITCKKASFYNLFSKGNKFSISKYSIDEELNKYVISILDEIDISNEECCINKNIPIIETEDPIDSKNNLRSSKRDSRHNVYRLMAINYALKKEEHNVKMMECEINNRIIVLKNTGEIILQLPYFGMEVITDVCKEIFPEYTLSERREEPTGTSN